MSVLSATEQGAFPGEGHPEDEGVTLTREERVTLIRSVDLGAQYYSRRNVELANSGETIYEP